MSELKFRAISLHQPWATAMALGHKQNETRNRLTHVRGDVVICSAQRKPTQLERVIMADLIGWYYDYPIGCALCVVDIHACIASENFSGQRGLSIAMIEKGLGDYSPGRFAWRSRNLRRLATPVPVSGKQGFFFITGAAAEAIQKQIV